MKGPWSKISKKLILLPETGIRSGYSKSQICKIRIFGSETRRKSYQNRFRCSNRPSRGLVPMLNPNVRNFFFRQNFFFHKKKLSKRAQWIGESTGTVILKWLGYFNWMWSLLRPAPNLWFLTRWLYSGNSSCLFIILEVIWNREAVYL